MTTAEQTRREFLKGSGALVVCFSASALEPFALAQGRGGAAQRSSVDARLLDSWIGIAADGSVTAHTGKCELGQGIQTAQTQLIAEELSVAVDRVKLIMGRRRGASRILRTSTTRTSRWPARPRAKR